MGAPHEEPSSVSMYASSSPVLLSRREVHMHHGNEENCERTSKTLL